MRRGEEPPEDGYQGDYVADLARLEGDPVPRMLERIEATMERFRIHFDSWAKQSDLERELPELLAVLPTYEEEGATFVRSTDFGDDKDRVLVRSTEKGGLPTYEAADVAYMRHKLDRGYDRAIYVLGADHHGVAGWFPVVARMLGYDPGRVEVLLYQLVHLTRGGEQTKMSKRRGDVVFLDEFLDEIGVDAARWYLVNRGPDQTIEIDVDLAAEKSVKNPVYYVQYAHARIAGILRNAGDVTIGGEPGEPLASQERELVKRLDGAPDGRAGGNGAPRAAGDPGVRDQGRRRFPPLLPRRPRARFGVAGVQARALPGGPACHRALPRPGRGRGARPHVELENGSPVRRGTLWLDSAPMRIGMLTGGGDCPGLNPVIRAVCRRLWEDGHETFGVLNGWRGMIDGEPEAARLGRDVGDPAHRRHDHRHLADEPLQERGRRRGRQEDVRADRRADRDRRRGHARRRLAPLRRGWPAGRRRPEDDRQRPERHRLHLRLRHGGRDRDRRDRRCHSTAESHNRIIVVETMGRHAGWIALFTGIAGGADYILIPEQPVVYDDVAAAVERRKARGKNFSVIVASEGCELPGVADEGEVDEFGHVRVENRAIGDTVAKEIEARTGMQARATVLGYIQRGGSPTPRDRILGLRFGLKAADLVAGGAAGARWPRCTATTSSRSRLPRRPPS